VNGGVEKYKEAFLTGDVSSALEDKEKRSKLESCLEEQVSKKTYFLFFELIFCLFSWWYWIKACECIGE